MTPEAQRIAIAETRGRCIFKGTGIREYRAGTVSEFCVKCGNPFGYHELPDYLNNLNAIRAVIMELTPLQRSQFQVRLEAEAYVCGILLVECDAHQWCASYLKFTGKWVEE